MKIAFIVLALFCATVYSINVDHGGRGRQSPGPTFPKNPFGGRRFRREADPQGSISLTGTKPLDGPDRRPTLNLDYNHRIHDNGRSTVDLFGGANKLPGQPIRPEFGIKAERNFGNDGFIRGNVGAYPGPHGRLSPIGGVSAGFRFRREADPQGSVSLTGVKPLDGPDRRPTLNLDYNHRIHDNGHSTVDLFGGANKLPGQPIRPEFGIKAERNFGNDGFIRGNVGAYPGPHGRLSPIGGVSAGFRFRRDAEEEQAEEEQAEETVEFVEEQAEE